MGNVVDPLQHRNKFRVLYGKILKAGVKVDYRLRNCGKNFRRNLDFEVKILHVLQKSCPKKILRIAISR